MKHSSRRTEELYTRWLLRFLRFHREQAGRWAHPQDMVANDIETLLTDLAVRRYVAASTQDQALNALVFLFRSVLRREIWRPDTVRARCPTCAKSEDRTRSPARSGFRLLVSARTQCCNAGPNPDAPRRPNRLAATCGWRVSRTQPSALPSRRIAAARRGTTLFPKLLPDALQVPARSCQALAPELPEPRQ